MSNVLLFNQFVREERNTSGERDTRDAGSRDAGFW